MNEKKTRVYNSVVNVNQEHIREFWNDRAKAAMTLKGVLLGEKFAQDSGDLRNKKECSILTDFIETNHKLDILDIGCGMGRWAANLQDYIGMYHGIDFSEEFVNKAKILCNQMDRTQFFTMSATDLDREVLLTTYDLVIITGVVMYINDDYMDELFCNLKGLLKSQSMLYLQESVSTIAGRLTLRDFLSSELNCNYSAIYRTSAEYEYYISKYLHEFTVLKTGLLLDEQTGAREETNARYWILRKS